PGVENRVASRGVAGRDRDEAVAGGGARGHRTSLRPAAGCADGPRARLVRLSAMPQAPVVETVPTLDLTQDVVTLTAAVCDIPSVSLDEAVLADAVEG